MRDHDYDRAEEEDRLHFIRCEICGKMFDCRDLEEALLHEHETAHATPPLNLPTGSAPRSPGLQRQQDAALPNTAHPDRHADR